MIGFENFLPMKWLDGVLTVHVGKLNGGTKSSVRKGKWLAAAVVSAATVSSVAVTPVDVALPESYVSILRGAADLNARASPPFAPDGYLDKLMAAIAVHERLPVQALEFDPPALV